MAGAAYGAGAGKIGASGGGGAPSPGGGLDSANAAGFLMAGIGAISSAAGAFFAAKAQQDQLRSQASAMQFQADLSRLNAIQAEFTAQQIDRAGQQKYGQIGLRAGKIKSGQRASMAARGIALGVGSAAETLATTDLMKEVDLLTVNAETVRSVEAQRLQRQNYATQAAIQDVSALNLIGTASTISPLSAFGTSLVGSGGQVANMWYQDRAYKGLVASMDQSRGTPLIKE